MKSLLLSAAAIVLLCASGASAQQFEKKNFNYSEFAKNAFSEAVTVTGPAKFIYLAGIGSEAAPDCGKTFRIASTFTQSG